MTIPEIQQQVSTPTFPTPNTAKAPQPSNQPNAYGAGPAFQGADIQGVSPGQGAQQQGPFTGWQNMLNNLVGVQAGANPYEQGVLGGQYLDIQNNPYIGGIANAITQQSEESLGRNLSQLASPFAGAGGTMGFSGINAATRANALDQSGQNLSNSLSQLYGGAYESERGRQQDIAGLLSGRTQGLYGAGSQGYASDQQRAAQEYAAKKAAGASRYASNASVEAAQIRADASLEQARMAQQLGYSELAGQLYQDYERNQQFASQQQLGMPGGYADVISELFGPYGTTQQQGTQGGGSQGGGKGGGALGGLGTGLGIYDALGGFGGGGGGAATGTGGNIFSPAFGNWANQQREARTW